MNKDLNYRLYRYKRKYYLNLIFKGFIYILAVLLSAFLFFNLVEYQFHSSKTVRAILFFTYLIICSFVLYKWLFVHLIKLLFKGQQISDELAAKNIGSYFPDINDKLLNLVQLRKIHSDNSLLLATIDQRSDQMELVPIEEAIQLKENIRYIKYLIFPFLAVAILGIISPDTITEPAKRIIQFNKDFIPQAPFNFSIQNKNLMAFRNEDFILNLQLKGTEMPESVYLIMENRRVKLKNSRQQNFTHTFEKIQESSMFYFEAAGFSSKEYTINVVNRPNINNFSVSLSYPSYLNKKPEYLDNIGNFQVPIGTSAKWIFNTMDVNEIGLIFERDTTSSLPKYIDDQVFEYEKRLYHSDEYTVKLRNEFSENKQVIQYHVEVIPDEYPKIRLEQLSDTVLFQYLIFGGNISDDYGLSDLAVFYRFYQEKPAENSSFSRINLNVDRSKTNQSFYYNWKLDSLDLQNGEKLEYYLQVRDNDAIHGKKATSTLHYTFEIPSAKEFREELNISAESSENQIDKTIKEAKDINQELDKIDNKLKGKKEMSWQDQQQMEDLIQRKDALNEAIKKLQEQFKAASQKRERFHKEPNEETKDKLEQLQKLMDELLDEETKKLYQELQKLLEDQKNMDELKNVINQLNNKEDNLEKELERTLELFKKMKFEFKLNDNIERTDELQEKQEKAAENSDEKAMDQESLQKEQQELNEEFKELQEELSEMQKLNQDLERPQPIQDLSEEKQAIENKQQEATENLENNKPKKASKAQQGASDQMKKLAEKLQSMQSMMMQSQTKMNLNQLRDILDNLIKLSFEQESTMVEFRNVHQSDPRFLELSQKQLLIKDEAKVIQDSLISLSKDDFRIQSIVTRKVDEMNRYLDESVAMIKERKKGETVGKQQFAMTSMNDLALMLDDVMSQMMNSMGMGGNKPQDGKTPTLSELQQQLGEKINELKKSGKSGRQLSEELAKMAVEQERIRQMLGEMEKELNDGQNGSGNKSLEEIKDKMEQNELDLVNKRLTDQLVERQKEIVTRMLEAENAQKERELDNEREAQQAKEKEKNIPEAFEDYIKTKEKEIELLKTVPPKLNPYYKKEVNEYFRRLGS